MESICKNCFQRIVLVPFSVPCWMHQDGMYQYCKLKIAEPPKNADEEI